MALFQSLAHRSFAFLWSGQTISRLGDSIYRIALAWWVLEKTGSATAMGTVLIFSSIPQLTFLLIGGVAVDRFSRGRVMLLSDLLRGLVVTLVAFLAYANQLQVWHIYIASLVFGFVSAFFYPAYTAFVPEVTPREVLPSANSLTALSGQMTGIVGPSVGALIVAVGGTPFAFALNALSFFISAVCLLPLLSLSTANINSRPKQNVFHDLREGLTAVMQTPWLWITITIAGFANLTQAGPYSVALPFLVKNDLHADVSLLGYFASAFSLGSVLVAIWLGHQTNLHRRGLIGYLGLVVWGLMTLTLGLPFPVWTLVLAAGLIGGSLALFNLIWTITLQELVPRQLLGRVSSIDALGSFVLLPVGYGLAGWATDLVGAPLTFIIGGALTMLFVGLGLMHPAIRNLE